MLGSVARLRAGLRERRVMLGIITIGVLLRVALTWSFGPARGFDYGWHTRYVEFVARNHTYPPRDAFAAPYHPPLYYYCAAVLRRLGISWNGLQFAGILSGILRLVILALLFEKILPTQKRARNIALFVAATLTA